MKVCDNCLERSAQVKKVPVGPEKGHQRDAYHETLDLCDECEDALVSGALDVFHGRYRDSHKVER